MATSYAETDTRRTNMEPDQNRTGHQPIRWAIFITATYQRKHGTETRSHLKQNSQVRFHYRRYIEYAKESQLPRAHINSKLGAMEFPGSSAEKPGVTKQRDEQFSTGNLQCLFYATTNGGALGEVTESIVRSNRVANAWIASLRSNQSPLMG